MRASSSPRSLAARPLARARTQLGSREMNASHRRREPVSDCPLIDYAARGEQTQRPMTMGRARAALPRRAPFIAPAGRGRGTPAYSICTHIPATPPRILRRLGAAPASHPLCLPARCGALGGRGVGREDAGEGATAGIPCDAGRARHAPSVATAVRCPSRPTLRTRGRPAPSSAHAAPLLGSMSACCACRDPGKATARVRTAPGSRRVRCIMQCVR